MRRRGDEIQISNLNFQILNPPRLRVELIRRALEVNPALRACENQSGRLSLSHSQGEVYTRDRDETHHSHRAGLTGPATADGLPVSLLFHFGKRLSDQLQVEGCVRQCRIKAYRYFISKNISASVRVFCAHAPPKSTP